MARKISDELLEELIHALMDFDDPRVEGRTSYPFINILAMTLIRSSKTTGSIKGRMKKAAWNNDFLEELVMTS